MRNSKTVVPLLPAPFGEEYESVAHDTCTMAIVHVGASIHRATKRSSDRAIERSKDRSIERAIERSIGVNEQSRDSAIEQSNDRAAEQSSN